jgi:amidophosphoribosyltransferase
LFFPLLPVVEFDTSCFSGKYVTGEKIGDEYFAKLHNLRNDGAQEKRKRGPPDNVNGDGSPPKRPQQSNDGCESVSNDTRSNLQSYDACEPLNNNQSLGTVR